MRSPAIVIAVLLMGTLVPTAVVTSGERGASQQQRAIVNFEHPTKVATQILMGTHISTKESRSGG